MAHHIFRDCYINVVLAIMYLELETDEIGQDGRGTSLGTNGRWSPFAGFGTYDG